MTALRVHPQARAELVAARRWYVSKAGRPVSDRFVLAVRTAFARIREAPDSLLAIDEWRGVVVRRVLLHGFPYQIVFARLASGELWVFAAAHLHRKPDYWRTRLR